MNQIKQLVLDAVMGRGLLGANDGKALQDKGLVEVWETSRFAPRPARWKWNKEALGKLSTEELVELWMREV